MMTSDISEFVCDLIDRNVDDKVLYEYEIANIEKLRALKRYYMGVHCLSLAKGSRVWPLYFDKMTVKFLDLVTRFSDYD